MVDKQVSELTAATVPLGGGELVYLVQSSSSRRATAADVAALAKAYTDSAVNNAINQINALLNSMRVRGSVRLKTTGPITIASALIPGQFIDGVVLAVGDLILVASQFTPAENGIYSVNFTPSRSTEYDTYNDHPGTMIVVEEGLLNFDTIWYCISNRGGTLGTTAINYSPIDAGGGGSVGGTTYVELSMFAGGTLLPSELLFRHEFTAAVNLPIDLDGSQGSAGVAPTADIIFSVRKNGVAVGAVFWTTASTEPTFQMTPAVPFAVGDVLSIVNAPTADATLANVSLSIVGRLA